MNKSKKTKILLLVDCQNDFITGSLANKEAEKAIPNILKEIKKFDGDAIVLTQDTHFDDYLSTKEGICLPVVHCQYETWGWEIQKDILEAVKEREAEGMQVKFVPKSTFSGHDRVTRAHSYNNLYYFLANIDAMEDPEGPFVMPNRDITIAGFCTDICVVSIALGLQNSWRNFTDVTVLSKCCAGVTPEKHEAALEVMKSCQINVK